MTVRQIDILASLALGEVVSAGNDFDRAASSYDIATGNIRILLSNATHSMLLTVPESEISLGGIPCALEYLRATWPTWFTPRGTQLDMFV